MRSGSGSLPRAKAVINAQKIMKKNDEMGRWGGLQIIIIIILF